MFGYTFGQLSVKTDSLISNRNIIFCFTFAGMLREFSADFSHYLFTHMLQ